MKKDLWAEGKWIDFWTINHFLSGVVLGIAFYFFEVSLLWSFILTTFIFITWEIVEYVLKWEKMTNQASDFLANYLGYITFIFFYYALEKPFNSKVEIAIVTVFILLEIWGFYAYRRRVKKSLKRL